MDPGKEVVSKKIGFPKGRDTPGPSKCNRLVGPEKDYPLKTIRTLLMP